MTLIERFEQVGTTLITGAIAAIASGIAWLIRRVLTNDKKLAMLNAEIERRNEWLKHDLIRRDEWLRNDIVRRDKQRDEDREIVKHIADKVDALYARGSK